MRRNIFLDFDGTLIDSRQRLYQLFMELVPDATFTFDEYWKIKRDRTNQNDFLKRWFQYTPERISDFKKSWLSKIEEKDRIALDTPFKKTSEFLGQLAERNNLYLVTARQNPDFVDMQLNNFGLTTYFKKILVTKQTISKGEMIKRFVNVRADDILIGDTGEDIMTAKDLGIISVAVSSGFLCRAALEEYHPDYLINSVLDLHETGLL